MPKLKPIPHYTPTAEELRRDWEGVGYPGGPGDEVPQVRNLSRKFDRPVQPIRVFGRRLDRPSRSS